MNKATTALEYFATNEWRWDHENVDRLHEKMSEEDRDQFDFNICSVDWKEFLRHYCLGTRQFILKDPLDTMDRARRKLVVLRVVDILFKLFLLLAILKLVSMVFTY